jgi:hypothetical protein
LLLKIHPSIHLSGLLLLLLSFLIDYRHTEFNNDDDDDDDNGEKMSGGSDDGSAGGAEINNRVCLTSPLIIIPPLVINDLTEFCKMLVGRAAAAE